MHKLRLLLPSAAVRRVNSSSMICPLTILRHGGSESLSVHFGALVVVVVPDVSDAVSF